jgi:DNA-binding NarL/FixJ family response regulator
VTRLLIVDDHEVVREGLISALSHRDGCEVVASVGTAAEGLAVAIEMQPDVALIDLRLPDLRGDELCADIRREVPGTAVVILSTYLNEDLVTSCLRRGASEYVTKAAGLPQLRAAIARASSALTRGANKDGTQMVKRLDEIVACRMTAPAPSPRQVRVLQLATDGLTDAQIARRLSIAESTVRFHLQKLKVYFGARTKTELVAKAMRLGFFPEGPK